MDARRRYDEMGSNSHHHHHRSNMAAGGSSSSSSRGSPDSPNGLKFGQKIYFGDVGLGALGVCHGGSSSSSATSPAAAAARGVGSATGGRRGRGVAQSGQPPRCQVEGCWVDLSDAKGYYSRHKVCCMHSKSAKVIVGGIEQRFCQQCSRFHQLSEFDHGKRSCRRRLAGHNERRRKPPTGPLLSSRLGRLSSSIFGVGGCGRNSSGGYLVDFGSGMKDPGRDLWPGTKTCSQHNSNLMALEHHQGTGHPPAAMWHENSSSGTNTTATQPAEMFLQQGPPGNRSAGFLHGGGTHAPVPSGECYASGVIGSSYDSSCALSLLSNQHWSSSNRAPSNQSVNYINPNGSSSSSMGLHHDVGPHHGGVGMGHYSTGQSWNSKGSGGGDGGAMQAYLGLGQVSPSLPSRFGGGDELSMNPHHGHGGARSFMEAEHSKAYGSSAAEYVNWSL